MPTDKEPTWAQEHWHTFSRSANMHDALIGQISEGRMLVEPITGEVPVRQDWLFELSANDVWLYVTRIFPRGMVEEVADGVGISHALCLCQCLGCGSI